MEETGFYLRSWTSNRVDIRKLAKTEKVLLYADKTQKYLVCYGIADSMI